MPGRKMVSGVFQLASVDTFPGCLHDLEGTRDAIQAGLDLPRMRLAWPVPVSDDPHDGTGEELGVLRAPLPGPAGVARGGAAGPLDGVDVFLALADVDDFPGPDRLHDLRQPVQDAADAFGCPRPPGLARGVRCALRELLVSGAEHLEQQLAVLVGVVVDGDCLAERRPFAAGWCFVTWRAECVPGQADAGEDVRGLAVGLAFEDHGVCFSSEEHTSELQS